MYIHAHIYIYTYVHTHTWTVNIDMCVHIYGSQVYSTLNVSSTAVFFSVQLRIPPEHEVPNSTMVPPCSSISEALKFNTQESRDKQPNTTALNPEACEA